MKKTGRGSDRKGCYHSRHLFRHLFCDQFCIYAVERSASAAVGFDARPDRGVYRHSIPDDVRQGAEDGFCPAHGIDHRADLFRHRAVYRCDSDRFCRELCPGGS